MTTPVTAITDAAFGAVGDGVTDDTAAIQACLNAARGSVRVPWTNAFYKTSSALTVSRQGLTIFGDGADDCQIKTTSATANIFTAAAEGIVFRDLSLAAIPTVTRSSGAPFIEITNGSGARSASLERILMDKAATGVLCQTGFVNIEECRISLLHGYGVGVQTKNGSGLYMSRKNFIGSFDLDQLNQPYAGLLLSDCGNADISSTQLLTSGYGILANPDGANGDPEHAQVCTSLFFSRVLADHCRVGWYFSGINDGSANNITMNQCWGCSSVYSGLGIDGNAGNITVSNSIFTSNGIAPGNVTNATGVNVAGSANLVTLTGNTIYGHANAADLTITGNASGVIVTGGNQIGVNGFPSNIGVAIGGAASDVRVTENILTGHSSSHIANTSSGGNITTTPNLLR